MKKLHFTRFTYLVALLGSMLLLVEFGNAQSFDRIEKGRMKDILGVIKSEVRKNYYDTSFHGIDLDARFKAAEEKLTQATSTNQSLAIIAQVLIDFNDSHLYFAPPATTLAVDYGWRMQAIGDKVYITDVKPGSDAEAKGLKPGDQVVSVSGFRPSRKELWKVLYYYDIISKRDKLTLSIISPGEQSPRDLEIKSQLHKRPQLITFTTYYRLDEDFYNPENDKHRFQISDKLAIWKMPSFDYDPDQVDGLVGRVKNSGALILDLRGNGGGAVKTMEALTSNLFDKDVKIADLRGRKEMDPSVARSRGKSGFHGKLFVLIDSNSASASEIFARLVQLEHRGTVLGDTSAGAVMQARFYPEEAGSENLVPFGVSITMADVVMSGGKSLEHVGVVPDEIILPTPADLAAHRDPVIARAVELAGGKMTPEDAGKLFKYYWKN